MRTLILRTQLDALRKNLAQVQSIQAWVGHRRSELQELLGLLAGGREGVPSSVRRVDELIGDARQGVRRLEHSADWERHRDHLAGVLKEAASEVEKILDRLARAAKIVESAQVRSVQIGERDLGKNLDGTLVRKAKEWLKVLDSVDDLAAEGRMAEAWEIVAGRVAKESQPVFTEYVDFLSGLVLRDAGFDEGICQIADELVRDMDRVGDLRWDSLTIPARQEALTMTLARIIRLGFPEWTIWTLPLTAHEFGHVVVSTMREPEAYVQQQADATHTSVYHLQELLADAFATYAMGPAYASAAILMRLNPLLAHSGGAERAGDARRAHVICAMLRRIDGSNPVTQSYAPIIETLEAEWDAAVRQAQVADGLEAGEAERLDAWVTWLGEFLDVEMVYPEIPWGRVEEWKARFLAGQAKEIPTGGRLRDVLNAAWAARLEQPERADEIEHMARELWVRIVEETTGRKGYLPSLPQRPEPFGPLR